MVPFLTVTGRHPALYSISYHLFLEFHFTLSSYHSSPAIVLFIQNFFPLCLFAVRSNCPPCKIIINVCVHRTNNGQRNVVFTIHEEVLDTASPVIVSLSSSFICHNKPPEGVVQRTYHSVTLYLTPEKSHITPTCFLFQLYYYYSASVFPFPLPLF